MIFQNFNKLDTNGKHSLIIQISAALSFATKPTPQKNKNLLVFFFINGMNLARVCKKFYFATLPVSQKMVYNVHQKKDLISPSKIHERRKHGKQCCVSLLIKKSSLATSILFTLLMHIIVMLKLIIFRQI